MKSLNTKTLRGDGYEFTIQPDGYLTYIRDGKQAVAVTPKEAKKIVAARASWDKWYAAREKDERELQELKSQRQRLIDQAGEFRLQADRAAERLKQKARTLETQASDLQHKIGAFQYQRSEKISRPEVYLESGLSCYHKKDSVRVGCNIFPWRMAKRVFKLIIERSKKK